MRPHKNAGAFKRVNEANAPASDPSSHVRLYGLPDADVLFASIDEAWEAAKDSVLDGDLVTFEEWTVIPPARHLPSASHVAEFLCEHASDDQGLDDSWEHWDDVMSTQETVALIQAVLDHAAVNVGFWQADSRVAVHTFRKVGDNRHPVRSEVSA